MSAHAGRALEELSDDELSEAFALEVAGLVKCDKWGPAPHWSMGVMKADCGHENCHPEQFWPPKFATSADAVLPWLEKAGSWVTDYDPVVPTSQRYKTYLRRYNSEGYGDTAARSACIALLKAPRAK